MSTPIVPARPTARHTGAPTVVKENMPQVPPRPIRKLEPSPSREFRSPLNELPDPMGSLGKVRSRDQLSTADVPPRPPSVTLPSIGQEGSEYASYDQLPPEAHGVSAEVATPELTRNVSANVPLHAPKASVPQSTAKSRIETVTRTDSTQAAAAGIGMARPDDDVHKSPAPADSTTALHKTTTNTQDLRRVSSTEPQGLRQKASFSRSSPSLPIGSSRPGSMIEGSVEQGIPEIGMQIPLNPNAGDVQAPSPAPTQSQYAAGVGYFNDGSARAHQRKRSARHEFGPPGSYGLHSHGQEPHDQFEREWYAKNPEKAAVEGYYMHGTPKPETALSSAELNKLVNRHVDVGMGTDPNMISTPGEEIAFAAAEEEYTGSRMSSPKPSPAPLAERKKRASSGTQPAVESPLRKTSFPFNDGRSRPDDAFESEDDTVHVDPPEQVTSKVTGGGAVDDRLDLGPRGGNTAEEGGWYDERGDGTPILASDEIMKRPGSAFMQPAVSPEVDRGDDYYDDLPPDSSRRNSLRVPSRPNSRPNSMHGEYMGGNLHRFMSHDEHHGSGMHTPLEEIEEYEPLIPEGEEDEPKPKPKAVKKRPGLEHHHFPSQDIWEDTPSSLQYQTTVETPEPPRQAVAEPPPEPQEMEPVTREVTFEDKPYSKSQYSSAVQDELNYRPGMHRFPSSDVWEDSPDSMRLETTVSGPQMDEAKSPPDDEPTTTGTNGAAKGTMGFGQQVRPSVPARPLRKSKLAEEMKAGSPQLQGNASEEASRDIPDVELPSPEKMKAPAIPDRPKPTVPARPARPSRGEQDGAPLSKSVSGGSIETKDAPPVPKAKPVVPARPGGEKIAALKAGFMSDLNNRLKLGPQAPPKAKELEPEAAEEVEKAPLADARKGRAKGPVRRKPAASPSAAAATAAEEKPAAFSMSTMFTMWSIDESDELQVPSISITPPQADLPALEKQMSVNEAMNTAEPALGEPMSPEKAQAVVESVKEETTSTVPDTAADEADSEQRDLEAAAQAVTEASAALKALPDDAGKDAATSTAPDETETTTADKAIEEANIVAKDGE